MRNWASRLTALYCPIKTLRAERLILGVLLAGLLGAVAFQAWHTGVTADEPAHLLSARLYWEGADRLKPRDMAPAIKIVGGWVPRGLALPVPRDHPAWAGQDEWLLAVIMMDRLNAPQIQRLFFWTRLTLAVFPLLTAWLIWRWARLLYSGRTALLLALAFILEPTALAHGALFKNDLAATAGYLMFWYCAWRYWRAPKPSRAAALGAALLLALLAKLSMLILLPFLVLIILLRELTTRRAGRRQRVLCALLLALAIPYAGSLAACQFEARRLTAEQLAELARDRDISRVFLGAARIFRLLPVPVPMFEGAVSLQRSNAGGNWAYLWGKQRPRGEWWYFLGALAVKSPIALQALLLLALALLAVHWRARQLEWADVFWLAPPILMIGLASLSTLQLGVRLVLPALPFGLLICGVAVEWLAQGQRRLLLAGLLAGLALESLSVFPHGISFFNRWAGGPDEGLKYLADSNLDWGQDLRLLRRRFDELKIPKLRLSYFGTDNPWAYFNDRELELIAPPWDDALAGGRTQLAPQPGYYAISASLLPGHFFLPQYHDFYRPFKQMRPVAKAGYSIFIYKVGPPGAAAGR